MAFEFLFQEFLDEIEALQAITEGFIAIESIHVLPRLRTQLENLRQGPWNGRVFWGIPREDPLKTTENEGSYERISLGRRGAHTVHAQISSVWEIIWSPHNNRKRRTSNTFQLVGIASTRVSIRRQAEDGSSKELAMWRVEVGDDDSPGCRLHVQILGEEETLHFPKSFPVPRLPSIIVTPMTVIEYVLGELFQDEWRERAFGQPRLIDQWRRIQSTRLIKLLAWQKRVVESCTGPPWTSLKLDKLEPDTFLRK